MAIFLCASVSAGAAAGRSAADRAPWRGARAACARGCRAGSRRRVPCGVRRSRRRGGGAGRRCGSSGSARRPAGRSRERSSWSGRARGGRSSRVRAPRRATITRFGGSPSSPSFRKTPSKLRPSGSARSKKKRMPGRGSRKVRGRDDVDDRGRGDPGHRPLEGRIGRREDDVVDAEDDQRERGGGPERRAQEGPGTQAAGLEGDHLRVGREAADPDEDARGEAPSGASSTTIHGRESATSRATSPNPALRRTAKSARKRIVRISRTNVYAAKPSRKGGQISRRIERDTRRMRMR